MPAVNIAPYLKNQYFDDNGEPLAGGLLYSYAAGTTDDKATYTDPEGTVPNANPVVLDAAGRLDLYLEAGAYDFVLTDAEDVEIWTSLGVSAGQTNTEVDTITELRAVPTGTAPIIRTLGRLTANDGGGWWFYWDAASTATDDGGMIIQPESLPAAGRWLGLMPHDKQVNLRIYGATCDGVVDDVAEIQACDAWCVANDCTMIIDGDTYFSTDPEIASPVILLPSVILSWGEITPTLTVLIANDDTTQHFDCTITTFPRLTNNEIFPEWFGEDYADHPITDVVIAPPGGRSTATKWYTGGSEFHDAVDIEDILTLASELDANAGADIEGNVDIEGTLDSHGTAHFYGAVRVDGEIENRNNYLPVGSDVAANTLTDDTNKLGALVHPHFDTDEEDVCSLAVNSVTGANPLYMGGGSAAHNAVTQISFYTGATATTLTGTERAYIVEGLVVGAPTGGDKGAGTINAVAVYDDNVLLTGYVLDRAFNPGYSAAKWKALAGNKPAEFCARADLMFNLDEYSAFIRSRRMLPTFEDVESTGNIPSTGALVQKLWEVAEIQSIHIAQLNERLKQLEGK